jgi:hypothetical protein
MRNSRRRESTELSAAYPQAQKREYTLFDSGLLRTNPQAFDKLMPPRKTRRARTGGLFDF